MRKYLDLYLAVLALLALAALAQHIPDLTLQNLGWMLFLTLVLSFSLRGIRLETDITAHLDGFVGTPALLLLGPAVTLWSYVLGQTIEHLRQVRDGRKFLFNTSVSVLRLYVLHQIFYLLGGQNALTSSLGALVAGVFSSYFLNYITFIALMRMVQGHSIVSLMKEIAFRNLPFDLTEQTLGVLAAFVLVRGGWSWFVLLLGLLLFLWFTLKQIGGLHQEHLRAEYMATHDGLTGLSNRAAFMTALHDAASAAGHRHAVFSVAMLDLNGFKTLNDGAGHAEGDAALRRFADQLKQAVYSSDVVARLGGDEFAVIMPTATSEMVRKKLEGLTVPTPYAANETGNPYFISAALGIATYPHDSQDVKDLLAVADQRMYEHKRQMKGEH